MKKTVLKIADIALEFYFRNPATYLYLKKFCVQQHDIAETLKIPPAAEEKLKAEQERLQSDPAFAEYSLLLEQTADPILRCYRFFFHGAAFIWRDKAFLFTGKSGVGKTTQLSHWLDLYGDEIEIINGDKPVIEYCPGEKDRFIVHPSPWTGKENWTGTRSEELAGIILLEQGDHDEIRPIAVQKAVFPLFLQFLYVPDSTESVDLVCGYEEKLLKNIPVWKLINTGTASSARLTHDFLGKELSRISG